MFGTFGYSVVGVTVYSTSALLSLFFTYSAKCSIYSCHQTNFSIIHSDYFRCYCRCLYVYQQLISAEDDMPIYYWSNDSSRSEVDFVVQLDGYVIPVEVKAEKNLKSLQLRTMNFKSSVKKLRNMASFTACLKTIMPMMA